MPTWKAYKAYKTLSETRNNQMTWARNVDWHQKKSRSILSRYQKRNPKAAITAYEFKKLERKVNANKNEVHSFRVNNGSIILSATGTYQQTTIDITGGIKGATNFREHVLGDKMRVKGFNFRLQGEVQNCRVILYRSVRTANVLDLTGFSRPLTAFYDKTPLKAVYFDKTYCRDANEDSTQPNPSEQFMMSVNKALNYVSQFNSDNGDLQETPNLRLLIIANGTNGDIMRYGWEAFYQNV